MGFVVRRLILLIEIFFLLELLLISFSNKFFFSPARVIIMVFEMKLYSIQKTIDQTVNSAIQWTQLNTVNDVCIQHGTHITQ